MKSLLLASALLHTFSQTPQPYKVSGRETVEFDTMYETYYESNETIIQKNVNNMGIYNVESYYAMSKTDQELNVLYLKLWTNQAIDTLVDPNLNINLYWDVIPEETQTGAISWFYCEANIYIDYEANIRTAYTNQQLESIKTDMQEESILQAFNSGTKTFIGNDRNDESNTINTTHQNEIVYVMYIDTTLDLYRLRLDDLLVNYEILPTTQEIIDVPGLFWTILGMPFAFISQAFNLTIFPGTPYSLNVANLLFTVIGAMLIIFIIRKFTR